MATIPVMMSVEEYLRSSFEPDVELVDGSLEQRPGGEWEHGRLQGILFAMFLRHEAAWNIWVSVETRVQTGATTLRVPDVCVTDGRFAVEPVVTRAPLLCVEVVSSEDRLRKVLDRLADYHAMGVAVCWVFDPQTREVWVSRARVVEQWRQGVLEVAGTQIQLDPREVFARAFQQG